MCLTTSNKQLIPGFPVPVWREQRTLYLTKKPFPVKKNLALLLLVLPLLLAESGCARRTAQQKKTSWYKHHSGGKSVPCPCGH